MLTQDDYCSVTLIFNPFDVELFLAFDSGKRFFNWNTGNSISSKFQVWYWNQ